MSCLLYRLIDGEVVSERVKGEDVGSLLTQGYSSSIEQLKVRDAADTNDSGKLSDAEVKQAAMKAGLKIGRKSIKTLKNELGL
tara:strand:+ start:18696 stop:18944 length:249 start_codon:yes stop_codon:yes gene_type:complete